MTVPSCNHRCFTIVLNGDGPVEPISVCHDGRSTARLDYQPATIYYIPDHLQIAVTDDAQNARPVRA
ncbi:hypothetical protein [Actinotalea ferrariae]|uniref:hypothetical protein n=1 Tax=Actinotalea ferrariae TaxID=1386098 RepID=UPI0021AB246B|nr:hypothetical protein [Actinotalea ferrariae]